MTDCLDIPVILREVLQHFSTTKLIQLSLVNKRWNYEARSVMKNRGDLSATINKNQTCQDLRAFASELRRMKETTKIAPFSGMTISMGDSNSDYTENCQQSPNRELDPFYEEILAGLTWNHLKVRILFGWEEHKYCPGFILMKKVLQNMDSVLEELSIQIVRDETDYFIGTLLQPSSFPQLKTFRLLQDLGAEEPHGPGYYTDLIKAVVSRAPNLRVFHSTPQVDLDGNLMEGSSGIHMAGYQYPIAAIPESVPGELRLKGLVLNTFLPPLGLDRFISMTTMLLQSSRTTLTALRVEEVFLVPLMVYGIRLENVRKFHMTLDPLNLEKTRPNIWRLIKSFDFTRILPKLEKVSLRYDEQPIADIPNEFIQRGNALLGSTPDRAANIKHLKFKYARAKTFRRRSAFRLLAQMFPDVLKVSIEGVELACMHIGDIWVDLKEVNVKLHCSEIGSMNVDSVFCGIFPEEVAQLREQDEEYLRSVNIVPVMPPLANLQQLKNLTVSFGSRDDSRPTTCTFSKVSGFTAFQRCPNLPVTLTTEDESVEQALSHLRPYATVVLEEEASD